MASIYDRHGWDIYNVYNDEDLLNWGTYVEADCALNNLPIDLSLPYTLANTPTGEQVVQTAGMQLIIKVDNTTNVVTIHGASNPNGTNTINGVLTQFTLSNQYDWALFINDNTLDIKIVGSGNGMNGLHSLLDTLPSGDIFVGDINNIATPVPMIGDVHIDNTGNTTIQPNVVTNSKIAQSTSYTWHGNNTNATANISNNNLSSLTEATSNILTIIGGLYALANPVTVEVKQATTSQSGYLSSTDWNTFNTKQSLIASPVNGNIVIDSVTGQTEDSGKAFTTSVTAVSTGAQVPTALATWTAIANAVSNVLSIQGTWDASTNTPTLTAGTGTAGFAYYVSVAGTQTAPSGVLTVYSVGDLVFYTPSLIWDALAGGNNIISVNGMTGIVSLGIADMDDVAQSALISGQTLLWNSGTNKWNNALISGTNAQVIVTPSAGALVLSLPQNIATASNPTFASQTLTNNTNQLILGTTNTQTVTMATQTSPHIFNLPNANSNPIQPLGSATANQVVQYVDATGTQNLVQLATSNLSDVLYTTLATDNLFTYNGTKWVNIVTLPTSAFPALTGDTTTTVGSLATTTTTSTNLRGTVVNSIPYQSASGITSYITPVNSALYGTNGSGVPTLLTTLPTMSGANLTGLIGGLNSSGNNLTVSVNSGVSSTAVSIINTNALGLTGTTLTSTVNGVASSTVQVQPIIGTPIANNIVSMTAGGVVQNSGYIINNTNPFASANGTTIPDALSIVNYVQSQVASYPTKEACQLSFNTNQTTLAGNVTQGGYTLVEDDRVLLTGQTNPAQNLIYEVGASPTYTWTIASDSTTSDALEDAFVFVTKGDNAGSGYSVIAITPTSGAVTPTSVTWTQTASGGVYTNGTGLSLSSGVFSITNTAVTSGSYAVNDKALYTVNAQGQLTASANVSLAIGDLSNVITTSLVNAQILVYNSTSSKFANVTPSGAVTIDNAGTFTIATNSVINSQLAQMSTKTYKGNNTGLTANASDVTMSNFTETGSNIFTISGVNSVLNPATIQANLANNSIYVGNASNLAVAVAMSGDVNIANTGVTTIQSNVVGNTKLAQVGANTLKGNNTGSTANASDLTVNQVNTMLSPAPFTFVASTTLTTYQQNAVGTLSANSVLGFPPASGSTGLRYSIVNSASSTNGATLTVGDITPIVLNPGQSAIFVSDGTFYQLISQSTNMTWVNYTPAITGTTTNPAKPAAAVIGATYCVIGKVLHLNFNFYNAGGVAGAANGSGSYLIAMPTGYTIDTTKATLGTLPNAYIEAMALGIGNQRTGGFLYMYQVKAQSTTKLVLSGSNVNYTALATSSNGPWGSGYGQMTDIFGNSYVRFTAQIPIL